MEMFEFLECLEGDVYSELFITPMDDEEILVDVDGKLREICGVDYVEGKYVIRLK